MIDGLVTVTLQRMKVLLLKKNVPASVRKLWEYTLSETVTNKIMQIAEESVAKKVEFEVLQFAA